MPYSNFGTLSFRNDTAVPGPPSFILAVHNPIASGGEPIYRRSVGPDSPNLYLERTFASVSPPNPLMS